MQFSMARKFKLRQLRRYSVKPSKMCKYALLSLRFRRTEIYAH